jgi:hypothetical protein
MAKSKTIFFSAVVVPLVVIAATIALAFAWTDGGRGTLFRVNIGYGVLLEALFFGWLHAVRRGSRSFTGAFWSIIGVWLIYYIVGGAILLAASFFISLKLYVTAIGALTLAWVVVGALVAETDTRHKDDIETTKEKNRQLMNRD